MFAQVLGTRAVCQINLSYVLESHTIVVTFTSRKHELQKCDVPQFFFRRKMLNCLVSINEQYSHIDNVKEEKKFRPKSLAQLVLPFQGLFGLKTNDLYLTSNICIEKDKRQFALN